MKCYRLIAICSTTTSLSRVFLSTVGFTWHLHLKLENTSQIRKWNVSRWIYTRVSYFFILEHFCAERVSCDIYISNKKMKCIDMNLYTSTALLYLKHLCAKWISRDIYISNRKMKMCWDKFTHETIDEWIWMNPTCPLTSN